MGNGVRIFYLMYIYTYTYDKFCICRFYFPLEKSVVCCLVDGVGTRAFPPGYPLLTFGNKGRLCLRHEVKIVPLFQKGFLPLGPCGAKRLWVTRRYANCQRVDRALNH